MHKSSERLLGMGRLALVRILMFITRDGGNFVASLCVLLLSGWVAKQAYDMGLGGLHSPGPGFAVFVASFILGLLALHLLVRSLPGGERRSQAVKEKKLWGRVVWVFLLLTGYVLFVSRVGYLLVTFATLLLLFVVLHEGKKNWVSAAIMAALSSGVTYIVFSVWFKLQLPAGWISWW
jgi:hypothetical protein